MFVLGVVLLFLSCSGAHPSLYVLTHFFPARSSSELWLIAGLFGLIGIDEIRKLLVKEWFSWSLFGFAFGASVGLLRERDRLLPMLQRLLRIILAVLDRKSTRLNSSH